MDSKTFKKIKLVMVIVITITVSQAVAIHNPILAVSAILIGMIFMALVRRKVKDVLVDEMVLSISGKAARVTYTIVTLTLAISSALIIALTQEEYVFMRSLGIVLSYITLFSVAVYSITYRLISRNYQKKDDQ